MNNPFTYSMSVSGSVTRMRQALYTWQANDPQVTIVHIDIPGDGYVLETNYDGTDWPAVWTPGSAIIWTMAGGTDESTNPNGNALRWGTAYNFRFDSAAPRPTAPSPSASTAPAHPPW